MSALNFNASLWLAVLPLGTKQKFESLKVGSINLFPRVIDLKKSYFSVKIAPLVSNTKLYILCGQDKVEVEGVKR